MWPFNKRLKTPAAEESPPHAREEFLLGNLNSNWTISDFSMNRKLTDLYGEADKSLALVFENGSLDPANGDMFDSTVNSAMAIALNDLNGQYALRPEGISKMVSWRARDLSELVRRVEKHEKNIADAEAELEKYKSRLESLNFEKKRGKKA